MACGAFSALFRLVKALFILAREGVFSVLEPAPNRKTIVHLVLRLLRFIERPGLDRKDRGAHLGLALNRLGPSYVKMGQFLATRPDLVGVELAEALTDLQDCVPPFETAEARRVVEEALGKPVDVLFDTFSDPLAAASIAQVHRASFTDKDGHVREVAVKILRPDIAERFQADLASFYLAARWIERLIKSSRRLKPVAVVDTLARSVRLEMDLRLEAAAMSEMAKNAEGEKDFRVPKIYWDKSAKSVMTMEWINGVKLSDKAGLKASRADLKRLGRVIIQSFLRHALEHGFFHADMHPGNLFLGQDGKLIAVDFGIMGRIGPKEQQFLAEVLVAFITRDYLRASEIHFDAGYVPPHEDIALFAQALRSIGEPIHGLPSSEISMADLLSQLFEFTELFGIQTRTELLLLQKTMVVVEGVARMLDPDLNVWNCAEPLVKEWVAKKISPAAKMRQLAEGATRLDMLSAKLPVLARKAENLSRSVISMSESGLRLDDKTILALAEAEDRKIRPTRWALWTIAFLLGVIVLHLWS